MSLRRYAASLFRRQRSAPAQLRAPLQALDWDGAALTLRFVAATAPASVALDLDGSYFASATPDALCEVTFAFAFAPSGAADMALLPRLGRGGAALLDAPLALRFGERGSAGSPVDTTTVLSPPAAERLVPYGADCMAAEVAIVVPVYNAADMVARCLDSVLAHSSGRARLIVIDDASPDPAIAPLLERYRHVAGVTLLRNEANRGFTATANRGIEAAGCADVVLLNADTQVGPHWLTGLRRAVCSGPDVATATAVSDNAGAFSVPELEQANALPACWTFDQASRALLQQAGLAYPQLPTGNGFCLYVRRAVLDALGALDEAAFPQGYGEENDFCQRAEAAGWRHVIAGNVLVGHARSQSFGDERRAALGVAGMAVLRARWPDYEAKVGASLFSFERRVLDWRVRRVYANARADNAPRPRVLWAAAAPSAPGLDGVEIRHLRRDGTLVALVQGSRHAALSPSGRVSGADGAADVWIWLQQHAIEIVVHDPQHLPDLDLPQLAARLGIACIGAHADAIDLDQALQTRRSFPGYPA